MLASLVDKMSSRRRTKQRNPVLNNNKKDPKQQQYFVASHPRFSDCFLSYRSDQITQVATNTWSFHWFLETPSRLPRRQPMLSMKLPFVPPAPSHLFFFETGFLYIALAPKTHYMDQDGFKFRDPRISAS